MPEPLQENILLHSVPQVYFLRCGKYTKIGQTRTPLKSRLAGLTTGNPYPIEVLFTLITPRAKAIEKVLHEFFAPQRVRGEWFDLSDEDLNFIDQAIEYAHP